MACRRILAIRQLCRSCLQRRLRYHYRHPVGLAGNVGGDEYSDGDGGDQRWPSRPGPALNYEKWVPAGEGRKFSNQSKTSKLHSFEPIILVTGRPGPAGPQSK